MRAGLHAGFNGSAIYLKCNPGRRIFLADHRIKRGQTPATPQVRFRHLSLARESCVSAKPIEIEYLRCV